MTPGLSGRLHACPLNDERKSPPALGLLAPTKEACWHQACWHLVGSQHPCGSAPPKKPVGTKSPVGTRPKRPVGKACWHFVGSGNPSETLRHENGTRHETGNCHNKSIGKAQTQDVHTDIRCSKFQLLFVQRQPMPSVARFHDPRASWRWSQFCPHRHDAAFWIANLSPRLWFSYAGTFLRW